MFKIKKRSLVTILILVLSLLLVSCTNDSSESVDESVSSGEKEVTDVLPIGSIIYLKEGTEKLMILSRGPLIEDEEDGTPILFDYSGCFYPEGLDAENVFYFNQENISEIVFEGYSDEEEERFQKLMEEWIEENKDQYKKIDITEPI